MSLTQISFRGERILNPNVNLYFKDFGIDMIDMIDEICDKEERQKMQ